MDQDRLEYAEASQAGSRQNSLGGLSTSKPVTELKDMFEAKDAPASSMKVYSAAHEEPGFQQPVPDTAGPVVVGTDMDWDDSTVYCPCTASSTTDALQQPGLSALSGLPVATPNAATEPVDVTSEDLPATGIQVLADMEPEIICSAEVVASASASPAQSAGASMQQQMGDSASELETAGQSADPPLFRDGSCISGQNSCTMATAVGMVQLLRSPSKADEGPLALQPSTTSSPTDYSIQDHTLGAAVSDASTLDTGIQESLAQEPPVQGAVADANILVGFVTAAASPAQAVGSPAGALVIAPQTETIHFVTAPPDNQDDDSMMVSPMPARWSTLPVGSGQVMAQVLTDIGAQDAAPPACSMPGSAPMISPDTAKLGVRAFQLDDIEELSMEAQTYADMPVQEQMTQHGEHTTAETPDTFAPLLQSISPVIDSMNIGAVTTVAIIDNPVDESTITTAAADVESAVGLPSGASAADLITSAPSVAAPPPLPASDNVPMADSLEAMEVLCGNDNLLEEPVGSATSKSLMPQVASSPVSAFKQAESPFSSRSGRKVAPGVVLQVERESLDLFSLRNSCASRVGDSLMVESLESFDTMGLCMKSRAMGFVPMAPLKEGDEAAVVAGRTAGTRGGSGATSAGPQSPLVTFPVNTSRLPYSQASPGKTVAATTPAGIPSANKPAACILSGRGGVSSVPAGMVKAPGSAAKAATPAGTTRANDTPCTALKAMAAANAAGASASKACSFKRSLPVAVPQPRQVPTSGQQVTMPSGPSPGSRLPRFGATPAAGTTRAPASTTGVKPPMPPTSAGATPGSVPRLPGATPQNGLVFSSSKGLNPVSGISRPGLLVHQLAAVERPGDGLSNTPVVFRADVAPPTNTPFPGSDFDLDTVNISAAASKAMAQLGGRDANTAGAAAQHGTTGKSVLAAVRAAFNVGTPTLCVLETHVQLLTNKLAEAEDEINQLQNANVMLRDQLSVLQFKLSMANDLDMERDAREYLEHEVSILRHQTVGLEADVRAAHTEIKRHEQAATETLTAQQRKEAEWARKEMEMEQRMQQMAAEVEAARSFAQQADARIADAEARAAAATTKCDEEIARNRELQVTLGLQAHQLVQVQRARDDAEAKFQRVMEQLIAAQTSHKKAVAEYEQKLLQSSNLVSQINDVQDKYRQIKQHAANADQRAQHAEAKAQATANLLAKAKVEKTELMQMCNELLTQLEATKVKGRR